MSNNKRARASGSQPVRPVVRSAVMTCMLQGIDVEVPVRYLGRRSSTEHYRVELNTLQSQALLAGFARLRMDSFPPGTAVHLQDEDEEPERARARELERAA